MGESLDYVENNDVETDLDGMAEEFENEGDEKR